MHGIGGRLTSSDRLAAARLTFALWVKDYLRVFPLATLGWSAAVRVVAQVSFLTLLARFAGGEEQMRYAFVGVCAHVAVLATLVKAPDVFVEEKWQGTLHRIRLGRFGLGLVLPVRSLMYGIEGLLSIVVALVVAGPLLGLWDLSVSLLARFWVFTPMVFSTLCFGIAIAALGAGKRADVLAVNTAAYVLMLTGDVVAPASDVPWLEALAWAMPLSRGNGAAREAVAGGEWLGGAVGEVLVGLMWLVVAVVVLALQERRARRHDTDNLQ